MRADLQEWLDFLRREAPVLRHAPDLFFQQAANQPDATAPAGAAIRRDLAGAEKRAWLKRINKPQTISPSEVVLVGHTGPVQTCSWSPDGARIASGGYDSTVRLWDAATGEELATLTGLHLVEHCVFSPDGHRLAAVDERGRVSLWDAASASLIANADPHVGPITTCLFSRDGMRLITVGSYTAKVRDARTGAVILIVAHDTVQRLGHDPDRALRQEFEHPTDDWRERLDGLVSTLGAVVSPDGSVILLPFSDASSSEAGVWSLETGRLICRISSTFWRGEFAPDGSRLVTIDQTDRLTLWNPTTGTRLTDLGDTAYRWAFSRDGSRLAVTSYERDAVPVLWDAKAGVEISQFAEPQSGTCAVSGHGRRLVTYSGNNAVLWDTTTGLSIATLEGHKAPISRCIFSGDDTRVLTCSQDSTLRIFDATDGRARAHLVGHENEIRAISFSPDGSRLVSASDDGKLQVWNAWWEGTADFAYRGFTLICRFSQQKSLLATLHWDALVKLWDATNGTLLATLFGPGFAGDRHHSGYEIAFSPDGTRLACAMTASGPGPMLRLWDALARVEIPLSDAPDLAQRGCCFSPDGAWLVTAGVDGLTLRDGRCGRRVDRVETPSPLTGCDFSPGGTLIVTSSEKPDVGIWRITEGRLELIQRFEDAAIDTGPVREAVIALSPDGSYRSSGGRAGLTVMDAISNSPIARCIDDGLSAATDWSPDGRRIAIGDSYGGVRLYELRNT